MSKVEKRKAFADALNRQLAASRATAANLRSDIAAELNAA